MSEWKWLDREVVIAIHDMQLSEHGGRAGTRDLGLLDSALARPMNLAAYGDQDFAPLAAAYGHSIARIHPFTDGNKRTAFVAMELFLVLNGFELVADDAACVSVMLDVAAGAIEEEVLARWIRAQVIVR